MQDIKYTSSGKKVIVLEKIQSDFLVQEICLNAKGEDVVGEGKFIERSLFNEPVESWQVRREREIAESIKRLEAEKKRAEEELWEYKVKLKGNADLLKRANFLKNKLPTFDWDKFIDIATGNIKWVINDSWNWYKPVPFDSKGGCFAIDDSKYEGLNALQIISKYKPESWDREFVFRMNRYQDGSGSYYDFLFFKSDKELRAFLLNKLKEKHAEGKVSINELAHLKSFIKIPKLILQECKKSHKDKANSYIKKRREEDDKYYKTTMKELDVFKNNSVKSL